MDVKKECAHSIVIDDMATLSPSKNSRRLRIFLETRGKNKMRRMFRPERKKGRKVNHDVCLKRCGRNLEDFIVDRKKGQLNFETKKLLLKVGSFILGHLQA